MNSTHCFCDLYLIFHHLVTDAFSVYRILVPELEILYRGDTPQTRPVAFSDAAKLQWERARETLDDDLDYWTRLLADVQPLTLPFDRPRPGTREYSGEFQAFRVTSARTTELTTLARSMNVTLFTVLLAGFEILLGRHANQDEFALATFDAGRDLAGLDRSFGYLLQNLVRRVDLQGDPSLKVYIRRVWDGLLEGLRQDNI